VFQFLQKHFVANLAQNLKKVLKIEKKAAVMDEHRGGFMQISIFKTLFNVERQFCYVAAHLSLYWSLQKDKYRLSKSLY
jgi:hypothetical protein